MFIKCFYFVLDGVEVFRFLMLESSLFQANVSMEDAIFPTYMITFIGMWQILVFSLVGLETNGGTVGITNNE